ncbi:ubiquitin-associated domain-containing protein 1 isoform X2 [Penaeus vannamei]
MAIGHFFNPLELEGISVTDDKGDTSKTGNKSRTYRLVLVREGRPLLDVNSLQLEQLIDNDELLLVDGREAPPIREPAPEEMTIPTMREIAEATVNLAKRNHNRDPDPMNHSTDFQIEFRRILITMIEASIRLISADPDSEEIFTQILDKLERRHRPRIDKNALRQLTDMGFPEAEATKALHAKRNVMEAMEWLLEQGNRSSSAPGSDEVDAGSNRMATEQTAAHAAVSSASKDMSEDPANRILNTFLQYHRKWFQPNMQVMEKLMNMGFSEEQVTEALRCSGNKQSSACELLLSNRSTMPDDQGLERDSPIISAILASPVIQLALPKPKTLLALMMLFESPNNANMWLSDPDTHPVVSQVLRIYHAEKHCLSHNRPLASSGPVDPPVVSHTLGIIRVGTSVNPPPLQQSQFASVTYTQPFPLGIRSASSNGMTGMRSTSSSGMAVDQPSHSVTMSPVAMRRSSAGPLPSNLHMIASSSPPNIHNLPAVRLNPEESMSLSGSPVRARGGARSLSDLTGSQPTPERQSYEASARHTQNCDSPITSIGSNDVEMEDKTDSHAMET